GDRRADGAPSAPVGAASNLEGFVGEYEIAPGRTIVVTLENGQLQGQPTGGPKRPLVLVNGTTFGVGGADSRVTVTFKAGSDGRATTMVMSQNGQERTLTRIK
ncbi:MAG TPA: DUF3471 domain-containing protein, partial [Gemmatimonadaceae bacterium]|nr:DUF3471 domain-containing protein [Gemmatimonadaceae bacterium]